MRSTLSLADGLLEWTASLREKPQRRPLAEEDEVLFHAWSERYRRALIRPDPWSELVHLGQEIFRWLDGGAAWLGRTREKGITPPWVVDYVVPVQPEPVEAAFLEVPWEVLSDPEGPLAANRNLVFCPVRRLGRPAGEDPPSPDRLCTVFMTALPEGGSELAFEDEETALLNATSGVGMDLTVEDSGDLRRLGELVGALGRVDVLHLSCHGTAEPQPMLLLEDELGRPSPASADALDDSLPHRPRMLFLSACETAAADRILGSLAASLVRRGVPALLGWGGSVRDVEAARFAAELYQHLSRKVRLDEAVARARLALLSEAGGRSRDWHQARLFAGSAGGGPLTAGGRKRTVRDRRRVVEKAFLDARGQVPVAGPEEFVGRRRDLQRVLRALRDGAAGVVVHGIGRQGKSSLTLRVVQRLTDYRPLVLHGPFDGGALLDALAEIIAQPAARDLVRDNRERARDEGALSDVLVQLLETYCSQAEGGSRPILFVLDDFEQLLEVDDAPPKRLRARFVEPVRALILALERAETESKLLITSRYTFTLPWQKRDLAQDLVLHPLPAMREGDRRKQLRTKLRLLDAAVVNAERVDRLLAAARGNPGLQDLLTLLVVEAPERADSALSQMEAYLAGAAVVEDERLVKFLADLALEGLVGLLSGAERELLRASTLFEIPIPEPQMAAFAVGLGLAETGRPVGERLVGLGLWEVYSPDTDPSLLVNGLARPQAGSLSGDEVRAHAARVVGPLFEAWGGRAKRWTRSYAQDLKLTRLALLAGVAEVVAACAEDAVAARERALRIREAAKLGRQAISLLDGTGTPVPLGLLRKTAELCDRTGDTPAARIFYGRARERIVAELQSGSALDVTEHASVLISHSRLLAQDGRLTEALDGFEKARELLENAGRSREVAVTLGYIARIKVDRGEVEAALSLHEERLVVFESLGDAAAKAQTLWILAQIGLQRGDPRAVERLAEAYRINVDIGRLDGICYVGLDLGRLLCGGGRPKEGRALLERSLAGFRRLGQEAMAQSVEELLASLPSPEGSDASGIDPSP